MIIAKVSDHISFLRPLLLVPVWTPALLGFWAGGGSDGAKGENELLLLSTFIGCGIYGLNQIYDVKSDRINAKNLPLSLGYVSKTMAWIITIAAFVMALLIAISKSAPIAILSIFALMLGIAYSLPPLNLKDRPYSALVANAVGHGATMYLIGYLFAVFSASKFVWHWNAVLKMLPYAFAYGAVYLFTTVPDSDGDKRTGKTTLATLLGERKTMFFGTVGVFAAGALGIAFGEPAVFLTAVVSMPFYITAVAQPRIEHKLVVRANKVAVITMAILTCFYFPQFVMPVAAAVIFSAIYNRRRIGIKYP